MKISHKWLQEYFIDTLPSAESLAELFTFHSFEIEGVEEKGGDMIIDAKILPDRAHFCLSYRGIAEEVAVLTGLKRVDTTIDDIPLSVDESLPKVEVKVEDEGFCKRYVSRRVSNINVKDSPEKVKMMLAAIDGRSINNVVDVTNIAMFDYGQPLHAFDANKVKGDLCVRAATEGETITLLDGREVNLKSSDSVVADDEGPLAIAGVKGGKRAEVTMETKNIIIESAHFHPASVRKTATIYNLRNESSKRFENEITPEFAMDGIIHMSALLAKMSPEAVFGPLSDFYPFAVPLTDIHINLDFIYKKLGIEISKERIIEILESLAIKVTDKDDALSLTIPAHRLDLVIKEDIVEEVGRIYGYDKIEGIVPAKAGEVPAHSAFYITEKIKSIFVEQGFSEAYLYVFTNKGDIEVAYPLASDKKMLRTNLTDGMAKALDMNARNADFLFLDSVKMFEIGKVFTKKGGEHVSLCAGIRRIKKVKGQSANEDIRQLREHLLSSIGANIQTVCTIDDTGGLMMLKGKQVGTINAADGILEINLDMLIKELEAPAYDMLGFGEDVKKIAYTPFSIYPFMVRDIAVFVLDTVKPEDIEEVLLTYGTELLLKHRLFDTFQKDGKISYAFRLVFQSFERTLTDNEGNEIMAKISSELAKKGFEVR